ncbi:MAG: ribonuclease III [Deltaproteobacteria bacterium]|nr:ribonuclease III [Deltaproteobacteria bacterium]
MDVSVGELEQALGYQFRDRSLLERALTHRSFANESGDEVIDNERLEFLGDAVVQLAVSGDLMARFPDQREGELSVLRAQLVSEQGLCEAAQRVELGVYLQLGKGEEQTGGRDKPSLLSDAFEAVCAAVYLDGGFEVACELVLRLLDSDLEVLQAGESRDYKTRLQELAQAELGAAPRYELVEATGPDHDKRFTVRVVIGDLPYGAATGKSKKGAEQAAAKQALAELTPQ